MHFLCCSRVAGLGAAAHKYDGRRSRLLERQACADAGASSGLGEALAIDLPAGANLVLRRGAPIGSPPPPTCAPAPNCPFCRWTWVTARRPEEAAEAAKLLGGPVDVLCYAAGVGQRTLAIDTTADGHAQIMSANFGAVGLRAVLPGMIEQKSGHVMVVSSVQGFFGQPGRSSYAASKAAIIGYLTRCAPRSPSTMLA